MTQYQYYLKLRFLTSTQIPDYGQESNREALKSQIAEFVQTIPEIASTTDGGGWEVISHNITLDGNTVIVSVLFQRPIA